VLAILNSLGAGEAIAILVIALIVLGPEKLPDAIRKFGNIYGELRRMSHGFQSEFRDAFDEPLRELRGTAQMMQDAVNDPVQAVKTERAPVAGGAKKATEATAATAAAAATTEQAGTPADASGATVGETQAPVEETQAPVDDAAVDGDAATEQAADDDQPVLAQAGLMVSEPEIPGPASNGQADDASSAEDEAGGAGEAAAEAPRDR
jgi:sec-independent protein translocase protein TatB